MVTKLNLDHLWEEQIIESDKYAVRYFDNLPFDVKWNMAIQNRIRELQKQGKTEEVENVICEEQERCERKYRTKVVNVALQKALEGIEKMNVQNINVKGTMNMELQKVIEAQTPLFRGRETPRGKAVTPLKGIVYGDNGVGKTITLSNAHNPIIADMEGNCGHIEVPKERIESLEVFHELLDYLLVANYNSLVIDSLDSLEILISEHVTKKHTSKELSYGNSGKIWAKYIKDIVDKLDRLHSVKRMNILITAHWKVKTANNPMTDQYDRYDLKINEQMRTGFCNWVQFICLALKEVLFDEGKEVGFGKKKAKTIERRVWYTHGDPTYYGKNVFNLPQIILMVSPAEGWGQFITHVKSFYGN